MWQIVASRGLNKAHFQPLARFMSVGGASTGGTPTNLVAPKGKVFQKEPISVLCERNQSYKWCSCGVSKKQPFCDGRPMCQPVIFKPRETKEYLFCNCKQTNNQPFCDGTHKTL